MARAVKNGSAITKELIAHARDPEVTIEELRAELFTNKNGEAEPKGIYFDVGGFFLIPGEKEEWNRAFSVAERVDPVIDQSLPEWVRKKEVLFRWLREFLAEYEARVERGEG